MDFLKMIQSLTAQSQDRLGRGSSAIQRLIAEPGPTPNMIMPPVGNPTGGGAPVKRGGGSDLDRFINSIISQESGGKSNALGVVTKNGDRAYGKYQIMGNNINGKGKGWDFEALGRDVDLNTFLNDANIQDQVARHKLQQYYNQYGAEGAAKAWYAGPGNAKKSSDAKQYGGPSINQYAAEVIARMMRG